MFWETIKYFKPEEFDSPDRSGSGIMMSHLLIKLLEELRVKLNEPIKINSGYRTKEHNEKLKGAVENSAHTRGLAVDITCPDSSYRYVLVKAAIEIGFLRIGVGRDFLHLDMDEEKPQAVVWLY